MPIEKDVDDHNAEVEDYNMKVVRENTEGHDDRIKKGCGTIFVTVMNTFVTMAILFAGIVYLRNLVTSPITESPEVEWVPVVNPVAVSSTGYVPAVYVAEFPNGDRCYISMGILVDDMSCVAGVR